MYKNILVPLDGSNRAKEGICTALNLSKAMGSRITMLQVGELFFVSEEDRKDEEKNFTIKAENYLRSIKEELDGWGVTVRIVTRIGKATVEICKYAEQNDVDLIVMTPHGSNPGLGMSIGSVPSHIVRCSSKPILLVNGEPISPLEGVSVLLVDDEQEVLEAVEETLNMCIVYKTSDSNTAFKFIECRCFDVVLLDINCAKGEQILEKSVAKGISTVIFTAEKVMNSVLERAKGLATVSFFSKEKILELKLFLEDLVRDKGKSTK